MILVTGGTGFVGKAILDRFVADGLYDVRAAVRKADASLPESVKKIVGGNLASDTNWMDALRDVQVVIHAAARVHVMSEQATDPLAEFRKVNVEGTFALARQAAIAGVRRFVFISSVKVNGEATLPGCVFSADDIPAPTDPYGISKMEAEQGLRALAEKTGMEVVIIRPPLVYGPGARANFQALVKAIRLGIPLPLGAVTGNRRSLIALNNLVDLVVVCAKHPAAANQVFLPSDGVDLSTADLIQHIGRAMGKAAHVLPVPVSWLEAGAAMLGKRGMIQRLCGNLQVDSEKTRIVLEWTPPVSVDEGMRQAVGFSS